MSPRNARRLGTAVALAVAVLACSDPADRGAATERDRVVRSVLSQDPASLSLVGKPDLNSEQLAIQITDSLVQYDERLALQPRVAESWTYSDDFRTLTFRLREDVRWHDGRPVTAADVVFTLGLVRDPLLENRTFEPQLRDVESARAIDERTLEVRFVKPVPGLLEAWRMPLVPRHRAEAGAAILTGEFARHPIGCGPFRFVRYQPGEELVLEANDDYWDGRPRLDRIEFRIYPDQRTSLQALLSGEIDELRVSADLWQEVSGSPAAARVGKLRYTRLSVWQITWNERGRPFFVDPRVRRSLVHALDRRGFIDKVLDGNAREAATSYHPDTKWAAPDVGPLEYSPERARLLLEQAGWIDRDGDGVRERDGVPFEITLLMPASTVQLTDHLAAWKRESWAEVGVRARIEKIEWSQFRERRDTGDFDAAAWSLTFTPNPDQFELYHSSEHGSGANHAGFADSAVDALLEAGRRTFEESERGRIYQRLQHELLELQPLSCLFHFDTLILHDPRLRGLQGSPIGHWQTTRGPRLWFREPED